MFPNFSVTSGAQLNEALQMQMEVQRRLNDQLEVSNFNKHNQFSFIYYYYYFFFHLCNKRE
ncbi:putative MYB-CC type transcription factor, LHEQLE-containing domain-containing protein [Helianthus anomalus]